MTRIFAFGLFGLSLFTGCGGPAPPKKNVVLVVIDTLRADRTSLYGGERSTTPAVDEWAQRGAVFDRLARVHKLGFAENVAAGFRRCFFEFDQGGTADGFYHAIVKVHGSCVLRLGQKVFVKNSKIFNFSGRRKSCNNKNEKFKGHIRT